MAALYYFTLTSYGSQRIAAAHGQATITLVNLVLGDANGLPYDPISKINRTSLVNQRAVVPVQSVTVVDGIAQVIATIDSTIGGFNIHELGLTDNTGQLVYIGNYHGGYKPSLTQGAGGELALYIDIKANAGSNILIQVSPTTVTANKQWVLDNFVRIPTFDAHVQQNANEHAQLDADISQLAAATENRILNVEADYRSADTGLSILLSQEAVLRQQQHLATNLKITALVAALYHVGSWHGSNISSYNPAVALQSLFGYQTTWYLWPYVPAGVASTAAALGQIANTGTTEGQQTATTRIWQRLPDGASPPSYQITASQTTVNEGTQVTFTLNSTGIAQGTPVSWNITGVQTTDISPGDMVGQFIVGADGTATKTITIVADEVTEGTEVLRFGLTYFSGLYVDVTINDTSIQVEQLVHITSNSSDLNLLNLFTSQYGQPTAATRAVFVVNENVNVIASSTAAFAIYGDNWPAGSTREIRVMSNSIVAGRGGDAGYSCIISFNTSNNAVLIVNPTPGGDGGTAIKAEPGSPITVNNYGLVAGGGGAAGGTGGWMYADSGSANWSAAHSLPSGGGAPYGKCNRMYSWSQIRKLTDPNKPEMADLPANIRGLSYQWNEDGKVFFYDNNTGHWDNNYATIPRPAVLAGFNTFLFEYDSPLNDADIYMRTQTINACSPLWPGAYQAQDGGLLLGGRGGGSIKDGGVANPSVLLPIVASESMANTLREEFKGASGGNIGENGQSYAPPKRKLYAPTGSGNRPACEAGIPAATQRADIAGAAGGLAGFIYQGAVTIINHDSGQSKGRTP